MCACVKVLTVMKLARLLFVILPTFFFSVETASAETKKVGHWRLDFSKTSCIMTHNGWGQNLDISYLYVPGLGMSASIEISGLKVKYGPDILGIGMLDVYAPYSRRGKSFFYSKAAAYNGIAIVSNGYAEATITNVFDFLEVIGGGGRFIITERRSKKKIATFTLNENKQASNLMRSCLREII